MKQETELNTKITLRRANALQKEIHAQLAGIVVKPNISISEFEDVEAAISKANAEVMAADQRRSDLLMVLYTLRGQVGLANAAAGITSKLGFLAFTERRMAQLEGMSSAQAILGNTDVLRARQEKIRNSSTDSYSYREPTVDTGVLSQDQHDAVQEVMRGLRKQKQNLNDEILELNVKTEIELPDVVVVVLEREGIM
jgi:hypothetical protein